MKVFIKFCFALVLIIGLEKAIRTQTDGFRLEKTKLDLQIDPDWKITNNVDLKLLNQTFYYLGSGVQCYAFIGEDKETVLKIFKQYHFGLPSRILDKCPLKHWKNSIIKKRKKRMNSIYSSCKIAFENLREETGLIHLDLIPTEKNYPEITIYDKIHIKRTLNLNQTPFLLQKKAELLFSYLEKKPEETKNIIESLFTCIDSRSKMGITNSDPILHRNFGVYHGKVIEIDTGSFRYNADITSPLFSKRELFVETIKFKDWITKNTPEHSKYFDEQLMLALRT